MNIFLQKNHDEMKSKKLHHLYNLENLALLNLNVLIILTNIIIINFMHLSLILLFYEYFVSQFLSSVSFLLLISTLY